MNTAATSRLTAIDALRGAVMVVMALDHTREFFHAGAMVFAPLDLSQTTPWIFLTRWVTHICAPVFAFLVGVGAYCRLERQGSRRAMSRFLLTRGLWLVLLEISVMRLALNFSLWSPYPVLLLVLWALGLSMIAMAALIHLPIRVLAVLSVAIIALHNLLDGVRAADLGVWAPLWTILHQPGLFTLLGAAFVVGYPVLPWIGVMAAGYCFGTTLRWPNDVRVRRTAWAGAALVLLFVAIRAVNVYGDPSPWAPQSSMTFTVLSFIRTTKYPPSLAFLLMTLGPALLALAWLYQRGISADHPVTVIGRVPLFFYVVHFFVLHLWCAVAAWLHYGTAARAFVLQPMPSMGGPRALFPADFGYSLWVVYLVWAAVVVALYPACRWFDRVKQTRRSTWLSYC